MKAIVQERFGSPDVMQLLDTDPPEIGPDDVLVRVHAAALNPYDWHIVRGDPYVARLMGEVGLTKPRPSRRIQTPSAAPRLTNAAPWARTVTVARAATCSKAPRVMVGGAGPASAI